jgi:hypothetical protein
VVLIPAIIAVVIRIPAIARRKSDLAQPHSRASWQAAPLADGVTPPRIQRSIDDRARPPTGWMTSDA